MASRGRGSGRGSRGKKAVDAPEEVLWEGSFGPEFYDHPDSDLPLQYKDDFVDAVPYRSYNYPYPNEKWPNCRCKLPCAMQVYDAPNINAGRHFFRCPNEPGYDACAFTKWVDPPPHAHIVDYIMHLHNKILNLQHQVNSIPTPPPSPERVISIHEELDTVCFHPDTCPCACHNKTRPPLPVPPPPPPHMGYPEWQAGSSGFYD